MKKNFIYFAVLTSVLLSNNAFADKIGTWYDSGSRTVYVVTDGNSPRVYLAGEKLTGGCIPPMKEVHSMNFKPSSQLSKELETQLESSAARAGLKVKTLAKSRSEISSTTPAVYFYNYTGLMKRLHFNVATDGSSSGWKPDSAGGCTYDIPS